MKTWWRWLWPVGKIVLAAAILFFVGREFYLHLQEIDWATIRLSPVWLIFAGALYLADWSLSAFFWGRLLRAVGEKPRLLGVLRAYFVGQMGKYVPGKALALVLRGALIQGPAVRLGPAILTAFYEVLTTMATGAFLAALIFLIQPPEVRGLAWNPFLTGLVLLVLLAVPLWPAIFNRLIRVLAQGLDKTEAYSTVHIRPITLLQGVAITGAGWVLIGLSLSALLQGVLPEPPALTVDRLVHYVAALGLAYVAGFLVLVSPSGIGVREYFLLGLLRSEGPDELIALAIILLRLVWMAAEIVACGLYWLPFSLTHYSVANHPVSLTTDTDKGPQTTDSAS